jgi:hypothetical protein
MNPFDAYPGVGQVLLGKPKNISNCRYGYGLELQRLTEQTKCAYCQVSLTDDYYHWLLMAVDYVVPKGEAKRLLIPSDYSKDFINLVLCCAGCNGFNNRTALPFEPRSQWSLQEFVMLREEAFANRLQAIATRRADELKFFLSKPWAS